MATIELNLLGQYSATLDGQSIDAIESDKGRMLLAYLAVENDRAHSRETLSTLFWPDDTHTRARHNLRQALYNLRNSLVATDAEAPYVLSNRAEVRFNSASDYRLDVETFTDLINAAQNHDHENIETCLTCITRLRAAIVIYKGDFLTGLTLPDSNVFEEWRRFKKAELRRMVLDALTFTAIYHERRREYEEATRLLVRQLELEPWREESHAQLMRVLALKGERGAALSQFELCKQILRQEFQTDPLPETVALFQAIQTGSLQAPPAEDKNPYQGLYAFTEEHADQFFGREEFAQALLEDLYNQRCTVVIGPSGSGKSSVIYAGVVPRLRAADVYLQHASRSAHATNWHIIDMRPSKEPFRQLAAALIDYLPAGTDPNLVANDLASGHTSLDKLISQLDTTLDSERETRWLIIVDQLDELYTQCEDDVVRRRFLETILAADEPDTSAPLQVLCVLRSDFISQAVRYRPLSFAIQEAGRLLGPMTREELRRAIIEPARIKGVTFQAGLVERLLDDVGDEPGNLPLLEFALTQLWKLRIQNELSHAAYRDIGGIHGALTHYADHVYERLPEEEQLAARRIFLRMVQPGDNTEDVRRLVPRDELSEVDWTVVQILADERLVVTGRSAEGHESAEVVHEALIRNWARLRMWLDADRDFRTWHQRLQTSLRQWQDSAGDSDALLRGVFLAEAQQWFSIRPEEFSEQEQAYVIASTSWHDETHRKREEQQERELAQISALAEAERRRADSEASARTRSYFLMVGISFMAVVAILAAMFAFRQSEVASRLAETATLAEERAEAERARAEAAAERAEMERARAEEERERAESERDRAERQAARVEEQAQLALSRQLAAQSANFMDERLDLALLLGVESLNLSPSLSDRTEFLTELYIDPFIDGILFGHEEPIHHIVFSADGRKLLSAGEEGEVIAHDIFSKQPVDHSLPKELGAESIELAPDGRLMATLDEQSVVNLWDINSGEGSRLAIPVVAQAVRSMQFGSDAQHFLTLHDDGKMYLWDTANQEIIREKDFDKGDISIVLSHDTEKIATIDVVDDEIVLSLWNMDGEVPYAVQTTGHSGTIHDVRFSPDDSMLATASFDGSIRLWDTSTGEQVGNHLNGHDGRVLAAAFSPDGSMLASGGTDNQVLLWDLQVGKTIKPGLLGHNNWVRDLAFSPDGEWLTSADADGHIILQRLSNRKILQEHDDRVRAVMLSPDGSQLITAGFDRMLGVWNPAMGEPQQLLETPHNNAIIQGAYSPDGRTFATGDAAGMVVIWDAATFEPLHEPLLAQSMVIDMAYSPDSDSLISGDAGGNVQLWDVRAGLPKTEPIPAHDDWTMSVAFSPDGRYAASGGTDGMIRLWEASDLSPRLELTEGHDNWVTSLTFTRDGEMLISGSSDKSIRFWDTESLMPARKPLYGHETQVWEVILDPSSSDESLISPGNEGSVIWWDIQAGVPLGPPINTGKETETMVVSPDGNTLYLGSFDPTVSIWDVNNQPWAELACSIANRNLTPDEWRQYLGDKPYRKTCPENAIPLS